MHISEINVYPIKSLGGVSQNATFVEKRGLQLDRRWMLVTHDGKFLTQREFPKMATLSVWIEPDGRGLGVAANRFGDIFVPMNPDSPERQQVTIWNSECEAAVYGAALNEWFSDVIETQVRLVKMPGDTLRSVNERFDSGGDVVSFADGYPLLLTTTASLRDLNSRLETPIGMERFRPNVVIDGAAAFDEDNWERIRIGDASFRITKPCARCVITTVDQLSGVVAGNEPLKTLASFRRAKHVMPERFVGLGLDANAVLFGTNLIPETVGAVIKVGDEVSIDR